MSAGSSQFWSTFLTDYLGLGSSNVTKESIAKSTSRDANIFERAIFVHASIPMFVGPGNRHMKSFAFAADHLDTQMAKNPEFDSKETEKMALIVPYAAATAVLEQYGFRNMLAQVS